MVESRRTRDVIPLRRGVEDSLFQVLGPKPGRGTRSDSSGLHWQQLNAKAHEMLAMTLESGGKKMIEALNAQEAKWEADDKGPAVLRKITNPRYQKKHRLWVDRRHIANFSEERQLNLNYILDQRCQYVFGQAPEYGECSDFVKMLWEEEVSRFLPVFLLQKTKFRF